MTKHNVKYPQIRNELRTREAQSKEIGRERQTAKGSRRHALWMEKQQFGVDTRYLILAYHILRGHPYKLAERKTSPGNEPSAFFIAQDIKRWCPESTITEAEIRAWLRSEIPAPTAVAA